MNRPEAEKLLGGYATGTLTDSEKQALFAAALEHQELFDALMDEEALRELLADPSARRRLLAVLDEPIKKPVFWRRPAMLGLAASLFLLVTTSLVVLRHSGGPSTLAAKHQAEALDKSTQAAQDLELAAPEKPIAVPGRGTSLPKAMSPPMRSETALKPAPPAQADESVPAQSMESQAVSAQEAEAATRFHMERKAKAQKTQAPAGVMAEGASVQAPAPATAGAMMADAKVAKAETDEVKGSALGGAAGIHVAPILERLKDGRYRLIVTWGPGGHVYVLKRSNSAVSVLPPVKSAPEKSGSSSALFVFPLGDQDAVDLYVLAQTEEDPASLPETGNVPGYRRRVHPE